MARAPRISILKETDFGIPDGPVRGEQLRDTLRRLFSQVNPFFEGLTKLSARGLTFTDNFRCEKVTATFSSGVPTQVYLSTLTAAKSALVLAADASVGHIGVAMQQPTQGNEKPTAIVTVWFVNQDAKDVKCCLLLFEEGTESTDATQGIIGRDPIITASDLNVDQLSAITANMGTLTAGKILLLSSTHLFAIGLGFGTSNQFLAWYGPRPAGDDLSLCTEAAAIYYLKTNGSEFLSSAAAAKTAADAAQATANLKINTFYATSAPTANATGDIWFDTDDNYKPYRWDGAAWQPVRDVAPRTFYQTSAPTAVAIGDIWFDTDDGFKPYRWDGAAWVSVRDTTIATAQTTADSKNRTFYQTSAPTAFATGDLWFDTDDNFKPYRWNGLTSTWDPVHDSTPIVAGDISATLGGGNMLLNSSFEDTTGALNNWTSNGVGTFTTAAGDTGQFRYGTKAAKFVQTVTGVDSFYYQRYAVPKPSTKYILTGWIYVSSISGAATGNRALLIYDGTNSTADTTLTTGHALNTWTRHSTSFTSSASPSYIECRMYAPNGTVYWDGIQLEEGDVATSYAPRPSELTPESVGTTELAVGAVTTAKMTANTINGDRITTNTLDAGKIVAGSITTDRMTAGTIDGDRITVGTMDAGRIVAGSISTTQMTANTINGDRITGNTLNANKIVGGTISATELGTDSVIAVKIQAGAIQADKISANQIVAAKISQSLTNYQNYWPNPTSEIAPPGSYTPPADGTDSEYDFRANVGANPAAYSGIWVREVTRTTAGTTTLRHRVPASPGESYGFRNFHRYTATAGTPTAKSRIRFLDKDFNLVGTALETTHSTSDTSWTATATLLKQSAPSDTAYVEFAVELATAASGTATIRWDAFVAFRILDPADLPDSAITPYQIGRSCNARAKRSTAQSITNAAFNTFIFLTEDWDGFNAYDAGTGVFTCPNDTSGHSAFNGKYRVAACVTFPNTGPIPNYILSVFVNGTEWARLARASADTDSFGGVGQGLNYVGLSGSCTVRIVTGDTVDVRVYQDSGAALNTEALAVANWVEFQQIVGGTYNG